MQGGGHVRGREGRQRRAREKGLKGTDGGPPILLLDALLVLLKLSIFV
jgi:hypothetical protein